MSYPDFISRHIGIDPRSEAEMLKAIGVASLDQLIDETVPASIRLARPLNIPEPDSEYQYLKSLQRTAEQNKIFTSYIGLGYYNCITPGVIQRNILENPGWYTAYTPYQAEIAQGRLEALLNFQTMVMDLTAMDIANASLLDEATAAAEAMHMFFATRPREAVQRGAVRMFVADDCFPQTIDVLRTRSAPLGIDLVTGAAADFVPDDSFFGAILQYPSIHGQIHTYGDWVAAAHDKGIRVAVAADLLSLTLLTPPGEWGADVVFGNSQRLGVPMGYGGPHAAFFAAREAFKREMPGRIIGVSVDANGQRALRMALQTREQHIRRDKATSNICTSQVLLAVMAGMYAVYHGPAGLLRIATKIHDQARLLEASLAGLGYRNANERYFDTLMIPMEPARSAALREKAEAMKINLRYTDSAVVFSLDETTDAADISDLVSLFAAASGKTVSEEHIAASKAGRRDVLGGALRRTSAYLSHPVFNTHHSETGMLRYITSLENKDLSLNHSMIPLGSCTMKLNATTEMMPVSWPQFNTIHPFVPSDQAAGYARIIAELEAYLCEITGFSAVSLQPNSGAQGEYAGLMVIRAFHHSRGQQGRDVALIPSSAHGTNPASAVMAGMHVVVVRCDANGNIDVDDLRAKAQQHAARLSCLMVTYPSTHGVFEESIREMTAVIHEHGGQVYMDGANMNAQVGLTNPAAIGADVCHLNLHKTFAIPHGGGGPGMGPIAVAAHLAEFLPGHTVVKTGGTTTAVSAAPWGSASILLISHAYIRMLGARGVTDATRYAILNANYIKARLEKHYKILYVGSGGRVAHEMILDCRPFKQSAGIEVEDIAKRLMDYGFHAPTMSFPVPGTMMVEPTESESKGELDRFCDALIAIRQEIDAIAEGRADRQDNTLKNAPHTLAAITADAWEHAYSRTQAAFPLDYLRANKFWPSVARVDNAYGDRNLVCACLPMEAYEAAEA
jgi:glycine dehydrogenase